MTNLMQQLQAWAEERLYDFRERTFSVFTRADIMQWAEILDWDNPLKYIHLVLDGTIPVWRPVEHYKPTEAYVLGLCEHECVRLGIVYEKQDGFWMLAPERSYTSNVKITHWMPTPALTQPPKEGSDDHNRRNAG
jgi:hypothetical protein